jgi:hypothetical protein
VEHNIKTALVWKKDKKKGCKFRCHPNFFVPSTSRLRPFYQFPEKKRFVCPMYKLQYSPSLVSLRRCFSFCFDSCDVILLPLPIVLAKKVNQKEKKKKTLLIQPILCVLDCGISFGSFNSKIF